jgi:hypothetical protein
MDKERARGTLTACLLTRILSEMDSKTHRFPSTELIVAHAHRLSERLQLLVSNDRKHTVRSRRDPVCLMYWSILFEHHHGMLLLLRNSLPSPAFALLRPLEEAFLRSFVAMHGTEKQVEALWNGNYCTEFEVVGKQIDDMLGTEPRFGPWVRENINALHGFTHGGKEQLVRQAKGADIVSNYTEEEVVALVQETMLIVFSTTLFITAFLNYPGEHQTATRMFEEYMEMQKAIRRVQECEAQFERLGIRPRPSSEGDGCGDYEAKNS